MKFPFSHGKERRDRRYSTDSGGDCNQPQQQQQQQQQDSDKKNGGGDGKVKSARRMLAFRKKGEENSLERTPPTGNDHKILSAR